MESDKHRPFEYVGLDPDYQTDLSSNAKAEALLIRNRDTRPVCAYIGRKCLNERRMEVVNNMIQAVLQVDLDKSPSEQMFAWHLMMSNAYGTKVRALLSFQA
jgi:hypothetical protein